MKSPLARDQRRRVLLAAPTVTAALSLICLALGYRSHSSPSNSSSHPAWSGAPTTDTTGSGEPAGTARYSAVLSPHAGTDVFAHNMARRHALPPPVIHARSAILVDAISGQVLFERNADTPRPMASTTKIMTALLFCEHVPDSAVIAASKAACAVKESSIHLKYGERLSAHDLLRAILMRSANDGCVDAAEYVAGSEAAFVRMMNERAEALGTTHTHFTNPHGLNDPLHYTTARDLALIARAAIQDARISDVVKTRHTRITRSIDKRDVSLTNHSRFLGSFPGADGIKTGWTVPAGYCYVGSATQHHWRLISVVLHSPDYVHETAALMRYGFANFGAHVLAHAGDTAGECPVTGGIQATVPAVVKSPVQVVLPDGDPRSIETKIEYFAPTAPLTAGSTLGLYKALVDGRLICASPLTAGASIPEMPRPAVHSGAGGNYAAVWVFGSLFALCLVSLRNGQRISTFTQGARRRGRRIAKSLRRDHYAG